MPDVVVSIVLPVYNGANYLSLAIDSILAQTFKAWELIIVDDGSTDETPQIIERYRARDARIRSIRNKTNLYLPTALNVGFDAAQGDFYTWTSHDNLYRPHAIERLHHFLATHADVDIVYSDYTRINDAGEVTGYAGAPPPQRLVMKSVVGASFMYRRQVQEVLGGYDPEQIYVEDYEFWLRASLQFKLAPLHEDLYLYRFHDEALTSTKRQQVMEKRAAALHRLLPQLNWATPRDLALGYLHLADLARTYRAPKNAVYYVLKALKTHPVTVLRHVARITIADPYRNWQAKRRNQHMAMSSTEFPN